MSDRASHPHGQAYLDYLDAWRAFIAPTVQAAIADLDVPQGGAVLDAGTGTGSALPALAGAVGPSGSVLGIDRDAAAVSHARDHVRAVGLSSSVELLTADFMDVVASRADAFDLIWTSDVIWPGVFSDPADTVRRTMRALKPGGRLALFYGNCCQATFLPAYPRLAQRAHGLRAALDASGHPVFHRPGDRPSPRR